MYRYIKSSFDINVDIDEVINVISDVPEQITLGNKHEDWPDVVAEAIYNDPNSDFLRRYGNSFHTHGLHLDESGERIQLSDTKSWHGMTAICLLDKSIIKHVPFIVGDLDDVKEGTPISVLAKRLNNQLKKKLETRAWKYLQSQYKRSQK